MPDPRSLHRRWWLGAVWLSSMLLHLPYRYPGGAWMRDIAPVALMADEGTVLYDAYRISGGQVMYRDFFQFQGPVFYHLFAALFRVTGPSVVAARTLSGVINAFGAMLIALVVGRFAGRLAGVVAAIIYGCLLVPMWPMAYPHWLAAVFALAGIALLLESTASAPVEFLSGVCFGLAATTVQSVGVPALLAATCALVIGGLGAPDRREIAVRPARVAAGALAVIATIGLYYLARGGLRDLIYCTITWPISRYSLGQRDALDYGAYTDQFIANLRPLPGPERWLGQTALRIIPLLPYLALPGALIALAQAAIRIVRKQPGLGGPVAALASAAIVAPIWGTHTGHDVTHVSFVACFGLVGLSVALAPALRRAAPRFILLALFGLVGAGLLANYAARMRRTWSESRARNTWRGEVLRLDWRSWVDQHLRKDDTIVFGERSGWTYLLVRPAAIGYTLIPSPASGMFTEEQWRKMADQIIERAPAAILVYPDQWTKLVKTRAELGRLYVDRNGLRLRAEAVGKR